MRSTTIGCTLLTSLLVTVGLTLSAAPARADIVAAYVEGHGGLGNNDAANRASTSSGAGGGGLAPALGFQLGARILIFEGYFDRTAFGAGVSASRGILGLRAGFGGNDLRLVLRGGGGVITEEGGALTGSTLGTGSRDGLVARAGIALEKRLAPGKLLGGAGLDGEVFSMVSPTPLTASTAPGLSGRTQGSDVFFSLYLKFELGI